MEDYHFEIAVKGMALVRVSSIVKVEVKEIPSISILGEIKEVEIIIGRINSYLYGRVLEKISPEGEIIIRCDDGYIAVKSYDNLAFCIPEEKSNEGVFEKGKLIGKNLYQIKFN